MPAILVGAVCAHDPLVPEALVADMRVHDALVPAVPEALVTVVRVHDALVPEALVAAVRIHDALQTQTMFISSYTQSINTCYIK